MSPEPEDGSSMVDAGDESSSIVHRYLMNEPTFSFAVTFDLDSCHVLPRLVRLR